ncbi:hypothetical protein GPOL_c31910 [Gordonia polyisoprenivorans VH2]|uniref:Transmembrane protein n=1 Tax=Gordonia polyisoprenivorans (strain DSM 44266 / VH2) TaxID=1112204 RepID=H6MX88_GORPV|nr:hypothetical protein GPOL_c31910 [Gordonia polyisoprenivorans VH2]
MVLSWDCYLGVPIGIAIALPTALSGAVAESMGSAFIAACGIAAAIATLVITAMTVLIGIVGPNYRLLLDNVTGGVVGILRPYRLVAILAVLASLTALCLGIVWPLVTELPWGLTWAMSAVPLALLAWSLLGCIQVVVQVAHHFSNNQRADKLAAEVADRRKRA